MIRLRMIRCDISGSHHSAPETFALLTC